MKATGALRVATYNVHRAVGADRRRAPERIVSVIREMDADILGLQEVEWQEPGLRGETQFETLTRLPPYMAVPGPNIFDHRGHFGNVLLTCHPVSAVRRVDLSEPGLEPRGAIDADVDVAGRTLRVIVTHLGLRGWERYRQARKLREAAMAISGRPLVLLGDFNEWLPTMPTLRPLTTLCARTPAPRSYPSRRPLFALDRILVRGIRASEISRHRSPLSILASDHLPILGNLGI